MDNLQRMFDEFFICDLRDMHQPVLMNADIHKRAKVDDIAHGSFQDHSLFQIFHLQHVRAEDRFGHLIPGIAARLFQLFLNIPQRNFSDPQFRRHFSVILNEYDGCPVKNLLRLHSHPRKKLSRRLIAFRMNAGGVQRVVSAGDPEKSGALFKCLRSQLGYLQQLSSVPESSVFFPVCDDVLCNRPGNSGNVLQKGSRGGVQIHANLVYGILHHTGQRLAQLFLVHIVLILSDADGFRINLYQFRQRVLHPPGDGSCASLSDVKIRDLLGSQLAGRIDGCSRLIGNHIGNFFRNLLQDFHNNLLRFPAGGSISHRNQGHTVSVNQFLYLILGRLNLFLIGGSRRVHHRCVQYLPGFVHNRQFAPGTERRIPAQNHLTCDWRLQQKLFQIFSEYPDGSVLRLLCQLVSHLPLDGWGNQAAISVCDRCFQNRRGIWIIVLSDDPLFQITENLFLRRFYLYRQELFLLPAVEGQDSVGSDLGHRLRRIVILLIYRRRLLVFCRRNDLSFLHRPPADFHTIIRFIGNHFRQNVAGSCQRFLFICHLFFLGNIIFCRILQRFLCFLFQNQLRQRLQTFLFRNRRTGAPFRTIRPVQILYDYHRLRRQNRRFQLIGQFPLFLDTGQHLFFLVFQISQVCQTFKKSTQHFIVQRTRHFFPVTGDKRNRIALVDQLYGCIHLFFTYVQLFCQYPVNVHPTLNPPYIISAAGAPNAPNARRHHSCRLRNRSASEQFSLLNCYGIRPLKIASRWTGCLQALRFHTVCAVNAQTWPNGNSASYYLIKRACFCQLRMIKSS